jgi:hypothetical protein
MKDNFMQADDFKEIDEKKFQKSPPPEGGIVLGSPLPHDSAAPHVGPTHVGLGSIGGEIEGVNDAGTMMADVRVTRYEAETLYRHWFERFRNVEETCYILESSGSREWRESCYANYRMDALKSHVSEAFLEEIQREVERRNAQAEIDREAFLEQMRNKVDKRDAQPEIDHEAYDRGISAGSPDPDGAG